MAQHAQGAEGAHLLVGRMGIGFIELRGDPFQKLLLGMVRIKLAVFLPLLVPGLLDKTQQIFFIQRKFTIVTIRRTSQPLATNCAMKSS